MSPIVLNYVRDKPRVPGSRMRASIPAHAHANSRKSDATVHKYGDLFHDNKSARCVLRQKRNKIEISWKKDSTSWIFTNL